MDVDFTEAALVRPDLRASVYTRMNFTRTDLRGTDMRRAYFENCIFDGGIFMATFTVQVHIPEALRELAYSEEEISREVPVLLVLKRFRQGAISTGKAASLLGLSRREFLDLLAREGVSIYDPNDQELEDEWKTVQRLEAGQ
jgi:predicted HTH domain antitoxin